ncbi:ABC transporter substrate-binding protein [Anoxynatronum buryatiense]|uniref:Iron(III) transport system substrate-binding protein n=1 Tax=Anoxynatronum buryatiense TaxID=489973 RepID=A0AA45WVV4_9CLOT|nr:ABC transporter substrate-binding protein [Anoxynatronum buryatiense]SMP55397.1 iron(III) transport system substrate-binding protein [Anoxynatronum buryatiense]
MTTTKRLLLCLTLCMVLFLGACAPAAPAPVTEPATDTPAPEASAEAPSDPAPLAVREPTGEPLVVYSAGPGGLAESLANGLTAATGIEVEMFQGTTGAVMGRLEAEMANPLADVVVLASWPSGMDLKERGLLHQYNDAVNADLLFPELNDEYFLFGYSASALGVTYNTLLVDVPGEDWDDYAEALFDGVVSMPDPSESGSALDFIAGYISHHPDNGWDLFEALKNNGIQVAGANRPALDAVVSGSKSVVLAGVDYMAYGDIAKGEPLGIHYPAGGTVINPRPAMIMASSNNLIAAEMFIDYLLSDEAQQMVADVYILPGRSDVPAHPDRPGYAEIPQFDIDWNWMAENQQAINEQFQSIMR